jgi:hypothetical protein
MKQIEFERNEVEGIDTSTRARSNHLVVRAGNEQERLQASIKNLKEQVDEISGNSQSVAKLGVLLAGSILCSGSRNVPCA